MEMNFLYVFSSQLQVEAGAFLVLAVPEGLSPADT